MKLTKVMIILGMAALMLSGCGNQETPENKQEAAENEYFEVENLKWGMTVDEALKALDIVLTKPQDMTSTPQVHILIWKTVGKYSEKKQRKFMWNFSMRLSVNLNLSCVYL